MTRWSLLGLTLVGCARFPTPYPSTELAAADRRVPRAVVHYLSQPEADTGVCRLDREGDVLPAWDAKVLAGLEHAAVRGEIPHQTATQCWAGLLRSHPEAVELADRLAHLSTRLVQRSPHQPLTAALISAVVERPLELRLAASRCEELSARVDPSRSDAAQRLLDDLELCAGRYHGQVVDDDLLNQLALPELEALARRLPDDQMRWQAARHVVERRVNDSAWAAVRTDDDVVDRVLTTGVNAVDVDSVVTWARWDASAALARVVRIQANPERSTAALVGARTDREVTAEPSLSLAGVTAAVDGFPEAPLALCDDDGFLNVDPCLPPDILGLVDRYASLDGARVALPTDLSIDDVVLLTRGGDTFAPPLTVAGVPVSGFAFDLHFDPVPPVVFGGGADLLVDVYAISNDRLLIGARVVGDEQTRSAVVPRTDTAFRVVSRGRAGTPGARGSNGSTGTRGASGSIGSCHSPGGTGGTGGPGGPGGTGGPGGPGGAGGDVVVVLHCDECDGLRTFVQRQVESIGGRGGAGGPGGSGGPGGPGGPGGTGGSCTQTDSQGNTRYKTTASGSMGATGPHGSPGATGPRGPDGPPGTVFIRQVE